VYVDETFVVADTDEDVVVKSEHTLKAHDDGADDRIDKEETE
jgi:hypothetical protein